MRGVTNRWKRIIQEGGIKSKGYVDIEFHKGRSTIGDVNKGTRSKRATSGLLSVFQEDDRRPLCPKCFHHKIFITNTLRKCTRCKHVIDRT